MAEGECCSFGLGFLGGRGGGFGGLGCLFLLGFFLLGFGLSLGRLLGAFGGGFLDDLLLGSALDKDGLGLGELEFFALEVLGRAAGVLDFFGGGFAVPAGDDVEFFGQVAIAEDFHGNFKVGDQAGFDEGVGIDGGAVFEAVELLDVDDVPVGFEVFVGEAARGQAAENRGLAAFVAGLPIGATAAGTGALTAAAGGFAEAGGFAAASASFILIAGDLGDDFVDHAHGKSPISRRCALAHRDSWCAE